MAKMSLEDLSLGQNTILKKLKFRPDEMIDVPYSGGKHFQVQGGALQYLNELGSLNKGNAASLLKLQPVDLVALHALLDTAATKKPNPLSEIPVANLIKLNKNQSAAITEVITQLPEGKKLDKRTFNLICKKIANTNPKDNTAQIAGLAQCVAAMSKSGIKPTQWIGRNKLDRVLTQDRTHWAGAGQIMSALANKSPSALSDANDGTFKYIADNAKTLAPKADAIAKVFSEMDKHQMPIKGNRKPVMEMGETALKNLGQVLENSGRLAISKDEFEAIRKGMNGWNPASTPSSAKEPTPAQNLGTCVNAMKASGIPLISSIPGVKGNINSLMGIRNADNLAATAEILRVLQNYGALKDDKLVGKSTFDSVVALAKDGKLADKQVEILVAFDRMTTSGITLQGHRQPIIDLLHNPSKAQNYKFLQSN